MSWEEDIKKEFVLKKDGGTLVITPPSAKRRERNHVRVQQPLDPISLQEAQTLANVEQAVRTYRGFAKSLGEQAEAYVDLLRKNIGNKPVANEYTANERSFFWWAKWADDHADAIERGTPEGQNYYRAFLKYLIEYRQRGEQHSHSWFRKVFARLPPEVDRGPFKPSPPRPPASSRGGIDLTRRRHPPRRHKRHGHGDG